MRPQFFSWLFDDRNAWEKSLANPYYRYDLPIDSFMSLYQMERKVNDNANYSPVPMFSMPLMPLPAASTPIPAQPLAAAPPAFAEMSAAPVAEPAKEEHKEDGILSQDEIDALLSGI